MDFGMQSVRGWTGIIYSALYLFHECWSQPCQEMESPLFFDKLAVMNLSALSQRITYYQTPPLYL